MRVLTNEQMFAVENKAKENGIEFIRLMENAGSACAKIIRDSIFASSILPQNITILCGSGKNGGDGFVIARKLCEAGLNVNVILTSGTPKDPASIEMFNRLQPLSIKIIKFDLGKSRSEKTISNSEIIVDSIFGTGFKGLPNDEISSLFYIVNSCKAKVFSIDLPSGIDCNTGNIPGEKIEADITIAISSLKPAHVLLPGSYFCGRLIVADIGISDLCYNEIDNGVFYTLNDSEIKQYFPKVNPLSHKGDFGHVLSVCGSKNMQGAAVIAAKGAVLSGAGLVTAAFPDCAYSAIGSKLTEQLLLPLNSNEQGTYSVSAIPKILESLKNANVVLVGCGIGINSDTKRIVREIVLNATCPIVIDADGLNSISIETEILKSAKNSVVITPHPGEMARITGLSIFQIQTNRLEIAKIIANKLNVTVVLKGANTVVAQPNSLSVYVNSTGNYGMATGGSGDLLAGMIASFIAQGLSAGDSAIAAVYIHGLTGDITAKRISKRGLTPTACLEELPSVMSRFED